MITSVSIAGMIRIKNSSEPENSEEFFFISTVFANHI